MLDFLIFPLLIRSSVFLVFILQGSGPLRPLFQWWRPSTQPIGRSPVSINSLTLTHTSSDFWVPIHFWHLGTSHFQFQVQLCVKRFFGYIIFNISIFDVGRKFAWDYSCCLLVRSHPKTFCILQWKGSLKIPIWLFYSLSMAFKALWSQDTCLLAFPTTFSFSPESHTVCAVQKQVPMRLFPFSYDSIYGIQW